MAEIMTKDDFDAVAEIFNICFGAAANKLADIVKAQSKISKPQVQAASADRLKESLAASIATVSVRCMPDNVPWVFFADAAVCEKLVNIVAGKELVLSEAPAQEVLKGVFTDLIGVAYKTLGATLKKEFIAGDLTARVAEPRENDFTASLNTDFPDGALEVKMVFKVEGVFDGFIYGIIPVEFAKSLSADFLSAISEQVAGVVATSELSGRVTVKKAERLEQVIAYCSRIGNFALIEKLKAGVTVRLARKKMCFKELWNAQGGYIIDFDKRADDPIEIVFGETVFAYAEAVESNDKLGAKITEVVK